MVNMQRTRKMNGIGHNMTILCSRWIQARTRHRVRQVKNPVQNKPEVVRKDLRCSERH